MIINLSASSSFGVQSFSIVPFYLVFAFSTSPDEIANSPKGWVVEYGHLSIDCRDEEDAKRVVRNLRRRKGRIVARTAFGVSPRRWFEGEDLTKWLSGSPS
jgi:hypothetical protein